MTLNKVKTAVVGAGRMGKLHSRIYSQMDQVELVGVVDANLEKAKEVASEYGTEAYSDPAEILDKVDAVTVSVPTEHHYLIAKPFLEKGKAVLVEKPLADSLEVAREMLELSKSNNCVLQVGYSERFNPVAQAMKRLNFKPRFIESQRISPFTFRSTDIGVVLDMMIHDIDIILSMAKSPIKSVFAAGVNVIGKHEDIANVRIVFESGCVANMTASRLALKTERKVRVFSEDAYLSLDYFKKTGTVISKAANIDILQEIRKHMNSDGELELNGADWTNMIHVENLNIDDAEPLRLEQDAFIKAVQENSRPEVSAEDAVRAMELAELIGEKIREHKWDDGTSADIGAEHWS